MMTSRVLAVCVVLAIGSLGCQPGVAFGGGGGGGGGGTGATGGGSGGSGVQVGPDGGLVSGLPCDVEQVLGGSCWACHGLSPQPGAPRLVTPDDLKAPSVRDAAKTNLERGIIRMQATTAPMPPGLTPTASASDLAVLEGFVAAGYQAPACTTSVVPPVDTLLNAAPTCTSGQLWPTVERFSGDPKMNPGLACLACHSTQVDAPVETIGGTVYPTGHEPDYCYGRLPAGVTVVITGADNAVRTLTPNSAGNFATELPVARPYSAKVVVNGKERKMLATQMDGDCNVCHTQSGASNSPGRITVPMP